MSRFLTSVSLITAVIHLPVAFGIAAILRESHFAYPAAVGLLVWLFGVAIFVRGALGAVPERRQHPHAFNFLTIPYFIHWCAALWTIVPATAAMVIAPFIQLALHSPLALPTIFWGWTYVVGLFVCGYGILIRRRWFDIRHVDFDVEGLHEALEGYTIAHLSDLHIGNASPKSWGQRWAKATNSLSPDVTVITGDLVTSGDEFHDDIADIVGEFRAKDGVFVSMGNHDYFGDGEALIEKITARGGRVLRNEGVLLATATAPLYLAAVDDTWTRRADLKKAVEAAPVGVMQVLLAHDPALFPAAVLAGVDLVLSGHTHGGQIAFPFLGRFISLSHIAHQFHVGLYREGRSALYVHPGLGTTGPPMRLGAAPAIVMIRLRRAATSSLVPV